MSQALNELKELIKKENKNTFDKFKIIYEKNNKNEYNI